MGGGKDMKETSKAMNRRVREEKLTGFPWKRIFSGKGLDIGSGDDLLPGAQPFDKEHGDAEHILDFFKPETFDFVHASHVLEHMHNPTMALSDWFQILKPNGYLIGEVPSWELYEGKRDRSVFNPDHKSTFSMWRKKGGAALPHYHAPTFFTDFNPTSVRLIDTNYDYLKGASVDQTFRYEDGVECFIEFVLQKK